MKKLIIILCTILTVMSVSSFKVKAEDNGMTYDFSAVYDSLSDEVRQSLDNIGADSADANKLNDISFQSVIDEIARTASQSAKSPLKGLISIIGILLLCSLLSTYKNTLSSNVSTTINIVSSLCITCAVAMPAIAAINNAASVIEISTNLMLAYIPIIAAVMAASGQAVSSGTYYAAMIAAGEGVGQLSSKVIVPFLDMFLGFSITSSITPNVNLSGFTNIIAKVIKWILSFSMTVFTSILTIKQLISNSLDSVSGRAVRFALTSFVPVVGAALSDAYKTVQGSVSLLKSGMGIFVIIAVAFVYLPVIIECFMWVISLWIGKAAADVLSLPQTSKLLQSISTVFTTLIAILLCIMSIYLISSAVVLIIGGGSG